MEHQRLLGGILILCTNFGFLEVGRYIDQKKTTNV